MIGSSYGLLALGFTLIFGVMRRLNLSYGPSIMVGGYLGTLLYLQLRRGPLAVAGAVVAGAVIAGIYVERLCFAPMKAGAGIASMVSSFAIWMQLEQAAVLVLPRHTYPFPPLATGAPLEFGPFLVRLDHLIMLACALALAAAVHLALYRTRFGLGLARHHRQSASRRISSGSMSGRPCCSPSRGASAIGGVAGFLVLAVDQQVTPMFGMWATLKGLIAMMIGGLGSVPGAILGGLLLGVVEAHSQWYFGPQIRDLVAYVVLFAFLVLRPGGLLGTRARSRDAAEGVIDGRLSHRRPVQHRRHLVRRSVGLSAAADRRDFVRPAGLLRDRRLCRGHRHRDVGLAARQRRSFGARRQVAARRCWSALPTLRLHGLYFAIATLAFAEMVRILFELFRYQISIDGELVGPNGIDGFRNIRYIFEHDIDAFQFMLLIYALLGGDAVGIFAARAVAAWRHLSHDRRRTKRSPDCRASRCPRTSARRRHCRRARRHRRRALCASDDLCRAAHLRRDARRAQPGLWPDRRARHRARPAARRSDRHRPAGIDQGCWPAIA